MAVQRRIVLLGKSGAGKSSLANTIIGEDHAFPVSHSPNSHTDLCHSVTKTIGATRLTVIDTPGLFETNPNTSPFSSEIVRCLEVCSPGPYAFLLVLRVERYTEQEQYVVDLLLQYFSPEALKYTTVVFTHGENLPSSVRILEWAKENPALNRLLQKCGDRCHVVDNRHWRNQGQIYRNNRNQVLELLNTIDLTVAANGGSHFTSDLLKNPSLWQRFKDAPIGVQLALLLGVPVVGYLLYAYVPWAKVTDWIIWGAQNGATWIWQNLPTTDQIKQAIEYLSHLYNLFQQAIRVYGVAEQMTGGACAVM